MDAHDSTNLFGLDLAGLQEALAGLGLERYRAGQVFYWLYNRAVPGFVEMTNLPKAVRALLAEHCSIVHPKLVAEQRAEDGTRKFLFELADGLRIESVLIPSESEERDQPKRLTLCVSTQVGCPLACRFCATGSMKLSRNLSAGEIVGQWIVSQQQTEQRITNLVYMGMGEPLLNYDETMRSIELITHETTCGVGLSRITVSTAGLVDGIRRMADERRKVKLAISLHATTDEFRGQLMPINARHNLADILDAAEYYYRHTRRRVTWEYILFAGLNDTPADARRLVRLARRVPSKVNIIPFHPIAAAYPAGFPLKLQATSRPLIERFAQSLRDSNVTVMLRSSSGRDIDAACGQLAVKNVKARRAGPQKRDGAEV